MTGFTLDPRLQNDSFPIGPLGLCQLLLMNDKRWPWLILVPKRANIAEIHELTPLDQTMLSFETSMVAEAMKLATVCEKINIGALGNIVRQLHVHIIARNSGDEAWPGPVWGHGIREPYTKQEADQLISELRHRLAA